MDKLTELVTELAKKGVYIEGVSLIGDGLGYEIMGFAKSGHGILYCENGKIFLKTRYDQIDEIHTLKDIVEVAYGWDCLYCQKGAVYTVYCVPKDWEELYNEFGFSTENLILASSV